MILPSSGTAPEKRTPPLPLCPSAPPNPSAQPVGPTACHPLRTALSRLVCRQHSVIGQGCPVPAREAAGPFHEIHAPTLPEPCSCTSKNPCPNRFFGENGLKSKEPVGGLRRIWGRTGNLNPKRKYGGIFNMEHKWEKGKSGNVRLGLEFWGTRAWTFT